MGNIYQTPLSKTDFEEITDYLSETIGFSSTLRFIKIVDDKLALLADQPRIGKLRTEIAPKVRSFPIGRYVVFYQPYQDGILILRFVHGSRDIDLLFDL